ncbi:MAG: hypothetical protein Q9217_002636 [Psora testacea]
MSSLYNLEPQPTAKVLITTTSGELLLELFAKQIPLASRSFLQHCLDGYYNGTFFHRLVPGFILQGGDPTGTGEGGESIYDGGTFEDEFHSRLKWNRRGLLGMANEGRKRTNGSQFFMTLGECRELEGKNTLFGRVVGDTVFNLVKMGEAELGDGEKPLYPTKITGADVLVNPFEDMVRREVKGVAVPKLDESKKEIRKGKKKGGKVLLSFGGDDGEDAGVAPVVRKEKFNPSLIKTEAGNPSTKEVNGALNLGGRPPNASVEKVETTQSVDKRSEKATRRRKQKSTSLPPPKDKPEPGMQLPLPNDEEPSRSPSTSPEPIEIGNMSTLLDKTNAQIAEMKASMKRNVPIAPAADVKPKSALEEMIPATAVRGKKRKHGMNGNVGTDKQTLSLLRAFRSKLENAPPETESAASPKQDYDEQPSMHDNKERKAEDNDEEAELCDLHFIANCQSCKSWDQHPSGTAEAKDEDDNGWMSHALSFEKDRLGKDLTWKRKNEEELVVIDPREKEKGFREKQMARKKARVGGQS